MIKKIFLSLMILCSSILLVGCGEEMTPTEAVRDYLEGYVTLDSSVTNQLDDYIKDNNTMNDNQKVLYKDILKKQYSSLTYDIKSEKIEKDVAYVKVKINVKDLYKIQKETNEYYEQNKNEFNDDDGLYNVALFVDYQLDKMKAATETISYELDMKVVKVDGEWDVAQMSNTDLEKIHGIYNYEKE